MAECSDLQLTIVTNKDEYGPFGKLDGIPFSLIPGYNVVYTSGRAGIVLDQICAHYKVC